MADDGPVAWRNELACAGADEADDDKALSLLLRPVVGSAAEGIGRDLLGRYGSLAAVLDTCSQIRSDDPALNYLASLHRIFRSIVAGRLSRQPVLAASAVTAEYLMLGMAHLAVEHLRVLFLCTRNRLIADETITRGTINSVPMYPREILKRALDLGAASLILAHNHPSGEPCPSKQDIMITQQIAAGGRALDILVLDHFILSSSGWTSLQSEGML